MRSKKTNHERKLKALVEVNMTPLMDLTFMLLILFIITVPILDYTTDVTPPKMTTSTNTPEEDDEAVQITMDKDGNCTIGGLPVAMVDLERRLAAARDNGKVRVRIRASGERPYDDVISLIRPASHCGMEVQLETQGE